MQKPTLPRVGTLLDIRKEDYEQMLEIFDDGEELPPTWEEWMKNLEEIEQQARAVGALTRRFLITAQSFPNWCKRLNTTPDANGRMKLMLHISEQDPTPEEK